MSLILATVHGRGLLANRPAAAPGNEGYLYSASDGELYRSNGTTWEVIGGAGMVNPMNAAGDLIYGGAAGAPQRLAAPSGLTTPMLSYAGSAPAWAEAPAGGGGGGWAEVVKSADQTVTNSGVLVDDTQLVLPLLANKSYLVEMEILGSGANGANWEVYQWKIAFPALPAVEAFRGWHQAYDGNMNGGIFATNAPSTTVYPSASQPFGCATAHAYPRSILLRAILTVGGVGGDLKYQFCNAAAAAGREARTWAGSRLRALQLN